MQYFFNDHLRWSLGFETPNQGGTLVATVLPWLWVLTLLVLGRLRSLQGRSRWCWRLLAVFFVALECVATWALVKTYSRGALVGVVAALGLAAGLSLWVAWRGRCRMADSLIVEENGPPGPFQGALITRMEKGRTGRSVLLKLWKPFAVCLGPWLARGVLLAVFLGLSDFTQRLTSGAIRKLLIG